MYGLKSSHPKHIGSIIAQTLGQLGLGVKLKEYEVLEVWEKVAGSQIARAAVAESIRGGKLFVTVIHPAWRQELLFLKRELITKINKEMGGEIVKDIIFR